MIDASEIESNPGDQSQEILIENKASFDDDKDSTKNRIKVVSVPLSHETSVSEIDAEENPEAQDEFKNFIFFLHFPFVYVLSILAFVGACLEIGLAYPGQVLTEEIKNNLSSTQHDFIKKINDYISIMFMYFSAFGMELRECCLQTISFWTKFSNIFNPHVNDPVALALDIKSAFSPFSNWMLDLTSFN